MLRLSGDTYSGKHDERIACNIAPEHCAHPLHTTKTLLCKCFEVRARVPKTHGISCNEEISITPREMSIVIARAVRTRDSDTCRAQNRKPTDRQTDRRTKPTQPSRKRRTETLERQRRQRQQQQQQHQPRPPLAGSVSQQRLVNVNKVA